MFPIILIVAFGILFFFRKQLHDVGERMYGASPA